MRFFKGPLLPVFAAQAPCTVLANAANGGPQRMFVRVYSSPKGMAIAAAERRRRELKHKREPFELMHYMAVSFRKYAGRPCAPSPAQHRLFALA